MELLNNLAVGGGITRDQQNLQLTFQDILRRAADPSIPPYPVDHLVRALNNLLTPQDQFIIGRQSCAIEFLGLLLQHLQLTPAAITSYEEVAVCQNCQSMLQTPGSNILAVNSGPTQAAHIDLGLQVQARISSPVIGFYCSACSGTPMVGNTIVNQGNATIYHVSRNLGNPLGKSMTPMMDPGHHGGWDWRGQQCVAVLAHCGHVTNGGKY